MPNKDFYTIINPTGIMIMVNERDKEIQLCNDCIKPSNTRSGYVTNKEDCEHAIELIGEINNVITKE